MLADHENERKKESKKERGLKSQGGEQNYSIPSEFISFGAIVA